MIPAFASGACLKGHKKLSL